MKEIAILVPSIKWSFLIEDYLNYEYCNDDIFTNWVVKQNNEVRTLLFNKEKKLSRVYFGNEFCERLIPGSGDILSMINKCNENHLKMSLLTPYCSDEVIKKLVHTLSAIPKDSNLDEIIVNDWGVLHTIKNHFPHFTCIFGRVLDKMKRDPRLSKMEYEEYFSAEGLKMLQSPSASSESYRQFMSENEVEQFEIDNVIQGLYLEDISNKKANVYIPYGYVTNGRICQFAGIHNKQEDKFRVTTKCQHECQTLMQFMQKNLSAMADDNSKRLDKVQVIRKGNTVFYMNTDINQAISDSHIERIIYEPVIPM